MNNKNNRGLFYTLTILGVLLWMSHGFAEEPATEQVAPSAATEQSVPVESTASREPAATPAKRTRVIYPKEAKLDFEGASIDGELKNPAEFYFQHRPQEKMDSLVKRRPNFHREMLRDVVLTK